MLKQKLLDIADRLVDGQMLSAKEQADLGKLILDVLNKEGI